MFSSFKKAGEGIIHHGASRVSQHELGDYLREIFHETEFRFAVIPRLLMRKICPETPPTHTHITHPNPVDCCWYPQIWNKLSEITRKTSWVCFPENWPFVPIEYIMWGLIKLLGVLSVRQINCTFGSTPAELAPITARKCRHWWSGDSWHNETRRRGSGEGEVAVFLPLDI